MFEKNEFEEFGLNSGSEESQMRTNVAKTFGWMTLGILITSIIAISLSNNYRFLYMVYSNPMLRIGLLVAQFGVVIALAARLFKMKVTTARILFVAYAALLGVTLSSWLIIYGFETALLALGLSSFYFLALTVIGHTTKINLLRFGPILYVGLFSLIIVEVVMLLMGQDIMTMGFAAVGLLLFTGITAYDTQKMKRMLLDVQGDEDMTKRISIYSAFQLYLDFINIFIYILRILGSRK